MMWLIPMVLIIPNIILDITDYSYWLEKTVNILLPFGLYLMLTSTSRNVGRTVLFMFPLILYAAFQVVLLVLYGESIISIDMFLSIMASNPGEAGELLGNLSTAIIMVIVAYLLPFVWALSLILTHRNAPVKAVNRAAKAGRWSFTAGMVTLLACYAVIPGFDILRDVFPFNVVHNTYLAGRRVAATRDYHEMSASFNHQAASTRDRDLTEVYVLCIGETSRTGHWQLAGYGRPTTPRLAARGDSIVFFKKALSQSNTTHKSVPLMLAPVTTSTFSDSIYTTKSLISAFNQAGFNTAFFSNQARNRSFIDFFANEAGTSAFLFDDRKHHYDHELLGYLRDFVNRSSAHKLLIVLHTSGSHFNYKDRYTSEYEVFKPAKASAADPDFRDQLVNAYDNSILYTDALVDEVISFLDSLDCVAGLMYLSDHGEDIFDDSRQRILHSSPVPTAYQIHVPIVMWTSEEYNTLAPQIRANAVAHRDNQIASNDVVFHTMLELGGIKSRTLDTTRSLVDKSYRDRPRVYLNDYNEEVPLEEIGLRSYDKDYFDKIKISYK